MKKHEESKIIALLNYVGYTEEESDKILDLIDNQNRDEMDMENLLENLKNWEDWTMLFAILIFIGLAMSTAKELTKWVINI